jgi:hypothetical protein
MTTLNFNQIEKLSMSEKARLVHDALNSLCHDFQKSDLHSDILEGRYPFADSCDETAAQVWEWMEHIQEREKEVPMIQNRIELEVLHSDTFKKTMNDINATIFVKCFNNDKGAHKDYIFKWQTNCDDPMTFYNGITIYDARSHEEIIAQWLSDEYEEDEHFSLDEQEFYGWLQETM